MRINAFVAGAGPATPFYRQALYKLGWCYFKQGLFEEALTHFLGGDDKVSVPVPVIGKKGRLANQKFRLLAPDVAFKLTAFPDRLEAFEVHARKLLQHTALKAIHWANVTHQQVTFTTIQ